MTVSHSTYTNIHLWVFAALTAVAFLAAVTLSRTGVAFGDLVGTAQFLKAVLLGALGSDVEAPLAEDGLRTPDWTVFVIWCGVLFVAVIGVFFGISRLLARVLTTGGPRGFATVKQWRARTRAQAGAAVMEPFGILGGQPIRDREEDSAVLVAIPGQGKTVRLVVKWIRRAAGPVIATSTKNDILRLTAKARADRGTVFVFDP